jgi:prevent-host-death family protein
MSGETYSTYDAKARFSELLRKVREGGSVTITYRGEPVAELRPVERPEDIDARIEQPRARGIVQPPHEGPRWKPLARRPGAPARRG